MLPNPRIRFLLDDPSTLLRDRPRHAASMLEMFIRSVDDGIHFFGCDVALYNLDCLTCGEFAFLENVIHAGILPR